MKLLKNIQKIGLCISGGLDVVLPLPQFRRNQLGYFSFSFTVAYINFQSHCNHMVKTPIVLLFVNFYRWLLLVISPIVTTWLREPLGYFLSISTATSAEKFWQPWLDAVTIIFGNHVILIQCDLPVCQHTCENHAISMWLLFSTHVGTMRYPCDYCSVHMWEPCDYCSLVN